MDRSADGGIFGKVCAVRTVSGTAESLWDQLVCERKARHTVAFNVNTKTAGSNRGYGVISTDGLFAAGADIIYKNSRQCQGAG